MAQPFSERARVAEGAEDFRRILENNLFHVRGQAIQSASHLDIYDALSITVRDQLIERWRRTTDLYFESNPKFVYYLSAEYLLGKQLAQNLLYTGHRGAGPRGPRRSYGLDLDELLELDVEPGLGNGGLGRLAACFLDSLATLGHPRRRLRHPLRVRHLQADLRGRLAGGEARRVAAATATPGSSRSPTTWSRWASAAAPSTTPTRTAAPRVRWVAARDASSASPTTCWCPATAPTPSTLLRLWRARATEEFDFELLRRRRLRPRRRAEGPLGEHHQGALPQRRHARRARSCACSSSTSSSPARCTTSSAASASSNDDWDAASRTRSPSSSTTPTRRSPSPS